jgi:uncharacterized membrane protein
MFSILRAVIRHTPLMLALVAGAAIALALAFFTPAFTQLTRTLFAWDGAIVAYLLAVTAQTRGVTAADFAKHAAETDEGRYFILFVSLAAVALSFAAIILELQANAETDMSKGLLVAFVFVTVALSWLFVHTSFAKHYAHEFYGPRDGGIREGLLFPGGEEPDFADFLHFALVIGVANQTADVQIASKPIRRIVTLHGIAAFVFNTGILALAINQAAGLFGQLR